MAKAWLRRRQIAFNQQPTMVFAIYVAQVTFKSGIHSRSYANRAYMHREQIFTSAKCRHHFVNFDLVLFW